MPPGTGDVSISLAQLLPRAEVVIVTTPQKLAQDVASRAAGMARKTNMRLLGVIENMSGDVFGTGGGEELAAELDIPLLGTVPLDPGAARAGRPRRPGRQRRSRMRRPRARSSPSPRRSTRGAKPAGSSRHSRSSASAYIRQRRRGARDLRARPARQARRGARLLHDDVSWHPAREGAWKPCVDADEVAADAAVACGHEQVPPGRHRSTSATASLVQLRGRGIDRLGAKGLFPRLFQIVVFRDGKVASIQDYPRREDAFAAAGLKAG